MDTLFYTAGCLAITLLAFLALKPFDRDVSYGFGLLFVAYVVLDDFITGLPYTAEIFDLNPGQWNWAGKFYSILLSGAVIAGLRMNASATGLVLPQRRIQAGIITTVLLIPMGVLLALLFQPDAASAETLAFQLLMPALAEEVAFRGIAPALLLDSSAGRVPGRRYLGLWYASPPSLSGSCTASIFPREHSRSTSCRPCGPSAAESSTAGCASVRGACCSRCFPTALRTWHFISHR
jgi:uncharacterized protein